MPGVRQILSEYQEREGSTDNSNAVDLEAADIPIAALVSAVAADHTSKASEKRLGQRAPNATLQKAITKNMSTVVREERQQKRAQSAILNKELIRIAASVWQVSDIEPGANSKMTKVKNICTTKTSV